MIEKHPLQPFLPSNAQILFLGSFPPARKRWSIEFFYPNYINDMWRIMGIIFFNNKDYFCITQEKRFNYNKIVEFCSLKGIAIYDTATAVIRLKENASDKYLQIVEPSNIYQLLENIPHCNTIVTTGEKATITLSQTLNCDMPAVGNYIEINYPRKLKFFRMPSSSRAYPMKLENKAAIYKNMIEQILL